MKSALALIIGVVSLLAATANAGSLTATDPQGYPIMADALGYRIEAAADLTLSAKATVEALPATLDRFAMRGQDALPDTKARCCNTVPDATAY